MRGTQVEASGNTRSLPGDVPGRAHAAARPGRAWHAASHMSFHDDANRELIELLREGLQLTTLQNRA
ncbi:hypothetical protein GCM10010844_44300 [Deinococcus radiotolerans]|uniref:Uncharacterized protein n=1 Tax=Deinococcus radiotolerans TaxID=1309407 RepID=A0ABQ2FRW6_9DEIO|nr:hypothetical protein GCM10010844_44300 [Deinococcus radiotolerans]